MTALEVTTRVPDPTRHLNSNVVWVLEYHSRIEELWYPKVTLGLATLSQE